MLHINTMYHNVFAPRMIHRQQTQYKYQFIKARICIVILYKSLIKACDKKIVSMGKPFFLLSIDTIFLRIDIDKAHVDDHNAPYSTIPYNSNDKNVPYTYTIVPYKLGDPNTLFTNITRLYSMLIVIIFPLYHIVQFYLLTKPKYLGRKPHAWDKSLASYQYKVYPVNLSWHVVFTYCIS